MNVSDALKKMIRDSNTTFRGLAHKTGQTSTGGLTNIITRNNAQVSKLIQICNALDYDVIIKPRYGENKAERTIVLTPAEERAE